MIVMTIYVWRFIFVRCLILIVLFNNWSKTLTFLYTETGKF